MSEEQKIIDLENEISFLKNALYEKQEEIDKLNYKLAGISTISNYNIDITQLVSKDRIREKIKEINKKAFEYKCNYSEYYYKKEILNELLEE